MLPAQIYFDPAYSHEFIATRDVLFKILAVIASEDRGAEFISRNYLEHLRRVDSLIRVDQTLAKIRKETEFDTDSISVTVLELQELLRSIDWIRYISSFIPPERQYPPRIRKVRISQVSTVERMEELLSNMDDQTLSDYLDWKVIFHFSDFLGDKINLLMEEFAAQIYGLKGKDRTDECVSPTVNMFYDIAGKHFLKRHFDFESIYIVKELIEEVRKAFLDMLNENDWMDENTKKRAKQKELIEDVRNAFLEMLNENDWMDENTKKRAKQKLNFTSKNSYYQIVTTLELWMQDRAFHKLEEINTRDSFDASVTEVNAFYDGNQNQIGELPIRQ
ncbi:unnamed protein product [Strongylus vulgaris]|uniref:Peptidase M13 N-terminal domain-containing protein n=1 Tax=Strongylus vulgaris TaxID=40348 RepID=A0A3P7IWK0_STRVU|nr:unnamed protein product [Strongylus vulgaris]